MCLYITSLSIIFIFLPPKIQPCPLIYMHKDITASYLKLLNSASVQILLRHVKTNRSAQWVYTNIIRIIAKYCIQYRGQKLSQFLYFYSQLQIFSHEWSTTLSIANICKCISMLPWKPSYKLTICQSKHESFSLIVLP